MFRPHTTSTHRKYRKRLVHCGFLLTISLQFDQVQAYPAAPLYIGEEVMSYIGEVRQDQKEEQALQLERDKPIERELAGSQSHSYQMDLSAGQYVKLVVDQLGIDVVVSLFGPDGKQALEVNS